MTKTRNNRNSTTIWISIETHGQLNRLKRQYEEIFNTKINFDTLIKALLLSKVNLAEEIMCGVEYE